MRTIHCGASPCRNWAILPPNFPKHIQETTFNLLRFVASELARAWDPGFSPHIRSATGVLENNRVGAAGKLPSNQRFQFLGSGFSIYRTNADIPSHVMGGQYCGAWALAPAPAGWRSRLPISSKTGPREEDGWQPGALDGLGTGSTRPRKLSFTAVSAYVLSFCRCWPTTVRSGFGRNCRVIPVHE